MESIYNYKHHTVRVGMYIINMLWKSNIKTTRTDIKFTTFNKEIKISVLRKITLQLYNLLIKIKYNINKHVHYKHIIVNKLIFLQNYNMQFYLNGKMLMHLQSFVNAGSITVRSSFSHTLDINTQHN